MIGDLSTRAPHIAPSYVDPELIGRLAGFGKWLCTHDGTDADVEPIEIFHGGVCHFRNLHLMKALVIGGGWAGISAAMEAVRLGWEVELVEERPYLGGRARSFVDRTTGDVIDNGQHVMMGCYRELLRVMDDLGTGHLLEWQQALGVSFVDTDGPCDVLDASRLPGRLGLVLGVLRLRRLSLAARLSLLRMSTLILIRPDLGRGMSCADLLRQQRQPDELIRRFWEPLVLATLNAPVAVASAELLVAVMRQAFLGSRADATLLIPTGGLSDLIEPLPVWFKARGGNLRLSTSADRLIVVDDRVRSVVLSDGALIEPDVVIATLPQRALQRLLWQSGVEADMPPTPSSSPIVSVYLWYDRQWMSSDFAAALGTTVQWVFNKHRLARGLVALTVSAAADIVDAPSGDIVVRCDAELRTLFGGDMQQTSLLHGIVIKEKQATPCITPDDQVRRMQTSDLCSVAENLFIAGDWTQTHLPATLEGAARSGVAAIYAARDAMSA